MAQKVNYEKANDQHIGTFVFYGKASDSKLYYDLSVETPVQVSQEDLEHAFKLGRALVSVTASNVETLYTVVAVVGNKAKTVDLVSSAVTVTEWQAKATA